MKLLETYSNNLSVDIGPETKPNLPIQFFPCGADKYVTLQADSGMPGKNYDLWQDVVNLIAPHLESAGIKIVQIGKGNVPLINKTINLVNQTNFAQSVYVLRNALAHMGNDSWAVHAAVDVPVVVLYGPTSSSAHGPAVYHEKSVFLESHRFGRNPSFQAQENPKTINQICPAEVSARILEVLEIPHKITEKTLSVGDGYFAAVLDIVPDQVVDPGALPAGNIGLRADLLFNLDAVVENLKRRAYVVHLNQEVPLEIVRALKPNIGAIIWEVDTDTRLDYLKSVIRLGVPLQLVTRMEPAEHQKIKLDYLDLPMIHRREPGKFSDLVDRTASYRNITPEAARTLLESAGQVKFYSKKVILGGNKIFLSTADWRNDTPADNTDSCGNARLNDEEFLSELNHFRIFAA